MPLRVDGDSRDKTEIIITSPKWPEPVEIKRVDYNANYIHIVGATTLSN